MPWNVKVYSSHNAVVIEFPEVAIGLSKEQTEILTAKLTRLLSKPLRQDENWEEDDDGDR
jgi:hypothetical protein